MRQLTMSATVVLLAAFALRVQSSAEPLQPASPQKIDLAERLAAGKLKAVNREVTPAQGKAGAVHLSEKPGNGIAWIDGTDFTNGTIELDVRGRDVFQQSFLGIAFHGKDDKTYEAIYLRPFNFRSDDPARHQHAVQVHFDARLRLATTSKRIP